LTYSYWTNAAATIAYATPSTAGVGTYYIKGTLASGCFAIKQVTVTINPMPVAKAGTGGSECDLNFNLNAVPSIGVGTWTKSTGPGTATFTPNANSATATATVSEYGNYTFLWTEVNGTCSNSSTVAVNFFKDLFVNAGKGGTNCGLAFYLNASLNAGTGRWTKVSGPGNVTFSPDANTANSFVTVTEYGSYTFSWSVVVGSCSNSATIMVNFVKQVAADAGTGGHKCGNEFMLNGLLTSGSGTWTSISGPGTAVFTPNNRQPNAKVSVDKEGIYDFLWTTENSTCTSSDIVRVIFHDPPYINAGADALLCKGSTIQLHAQGTGFFKWSPAALTSNPNLSDPVVSPLTTTTFSVTLTDQFGCENSDIIKVEVRNIPVANGGPDQVMDNKFNATMNAVLYNDYESGVWSIISGTGEILDPKYTKTSVSGLSPKENILLWTVSNNICPSSRDTVFIKISDMIFPTLITPNMDGRNDYFVFKGLNTKGKTELIIFDRRGVKVYSSPSYANNWNGVDFNDTPLPDDTYFFILRRENESPINGYIVIRR
jgi:gliding motility-associated-like protein